MEISQCALPVFEGLLPGRHNGIVLDLIFDLATWHAYAKLRLHTEHTLDHFDAATTYLGEAVRKFQRTTCQHYITTELPQEHAARGRRTAALAAQNNHSILTSQLKPKQKTLNLSTYKFHALGDYPSTIRQYGTTDSYTTQIVRIQNIFRFSTNVVFKGELEHRRSKRRYPRSGKKKETMVKSIANQDAIERFIKKVDDSRRRINMETDPQTRRHRSSPSEHYHLAKSSRQSKDLTAWLGDRRGDPAFQVRRHPW